VFILILSRLLQATLASTVRVHYHGTLVDGTVFDSSKERGEPLEFPLRNVIKGWQEGVALMKVGGKATLVCPPDIAYGDSGSPPVIAPGATLVFEVELLNVA
jgi:FKBP-type peptidyl-prolyl cis-trans isomerase FkpA